MDSIFELTTQAGKGEGKRKELAEHVLSHCNVFAGKAAVFFSRYDENSHRWNEALLPSGSRQQTPDHSSTINTFEPLRDL